MEQSQKPAPRAGEGEVSAHSLRAGAVETRHLVFFVLAAAAPLTVMAGFVPVAFMAAGEIAPAGYLIAGIVYALFAVGFTTMSRYVRNTGAFYAYITTGLGPALGSGSALVAYASYTLGEIGFCAAAGLFASTTLSQLAGIDLPWGYSAIAIALAVSAVAYRRVEAGARVLAVLLVAEVGVLVVLALAIVIHGVPDGYSFVAFSPANWSWTALGPLFVMTFVVYVGFEQTAVYSEEVSDPARTVPRATYLAVALLAAIYTAVSWLLLMAIGPSRLATALANDPSTLVFGLSANYAGTILTDLMQVLIVTSFIAGVLALHNACARYLFALGREGLLPRSLAATSEHASPATAVVVQAVIVIGALAVAAIFGFDPYTQVVVWTNTPTLVGLLFLQILTSIAVVAFFTERHHKEGLWHSLIAPIMSALALTMVLWLVCTKMGLLTQLPPLGNLLINLPLVAAFVFGIGRALQKRRSEKNANNVAGNSIDGAIL